MATLRLSLGVLQVTVVACLQVVQVLALGHDSHGNGGGLFDVVDFGARGDGITDDGPAIAKAYAACRAAGGGTVIFPGPTADIVNINTGQNDAGERVFRSGPIALACNHSVTRISAGSVVMARNTTDGWPLGPECACQSSTSRFLGPLSFFFFFFFLRSLPALQSLL